MFGPGLLEDALARHGKSDVFNTDQGSQRKIPTDLYLPSLNLRYLSEVQSVGGGATTQFCSKIFCVRDRLFG